MSMASERILQTAAVVDVTPAKCRPGVVRMDAGEGSIEAVKTLLLRPGTALLRGPDIEPGVGSSGFRIQCTRTGTVAPR
jgi:hypothetical protein